MCQRERERERVKGSQIERERERRGEWSLTQCERQKLRGERQENEGDSGEEAAHHIRRRFAS